LERDIQTWSCNDCKRRFRNKRREKVAFQKRIWKEYVFEKQTLRELKSKHRVHRTTLKNHLNIYQAPKKKHEPRKINLVADALYFGERKEQTSWCAVAFRDPKSKENIWWNFFDTETTSAYLEGKECLEGLNYKILSVTGDGFGGLRAAFSGIPFQMCHVHMERIVIAGTTRKPILEAGRALLALVRSLHQHIDSESFKYYLSGYMEKYRNFLNEKTTNPITGETFFTHDPLRRAALSLVRFLPFLFTFETNKNIPRTTNSLEGHFSHIRDIVGVHRGLKRKQMERVLHSIFLASTIAPTKGKLKHIL
jgi:hypothetical protein